MTVGLGNSTGPSLWNPVWPVSGGVPYSSGIFLGYNANVSYAWQNGWILDSYGAWTTSSGGASSGWSRLTENGLCCWGSGTITSPAGQSISFPVSYGTTGNLTVLLQFQCGGSFAQPTVYALPHCITGQPGVGGVSTTGFTAYFPIYDPERSFSTSGLGFSGTGLPFQWMAFGYS
jgi:hypothetical protein